MALPPKTYTPTLTAINTVTTSPTSTTTTTPTTSSSTINISPTSTSTTSTTTILSGRTSTLLATTTTSTTSTSPITTTTTSSPTVSTSLKTEGTTATFGQLVVDSDSLSKALTTLTTNADASTTFSAPTTTTVTINTVPAVPTTTETITKALSTITSTSTIETQPIVDKTTIQTNIVNTTINEPQTLQTLLTDINATSPVTVQDVKTNLTLDSATRIAETTETITFTPGSDTTSVVSAEDLKNSFTSENPINRITDLVENHPDLIHDVTSTTSDDVKTNIIMAAINVDTTVTVTVVDTTAGDKGTQNSTPGTTTKTVIYGTTLSNDLIKKILTESQRVDLSITMKSKNSTSLEWNAMQVPGQKSRLFYRRWEKNETDLVSQEDPAKDPLLTTKLRNVARYVELQWEAINVKEQITENEISKNAQTESLKDKVFRDPRGIGTLSNDTTNQPLDRALKNISLLVGENSRGKITDIHDIEDGFTSISNRHEFVNSVQTVVDTKITSVVNHDLVLGLLSRNVE